MINLIKYFKNKLNCFYLGDQNVENRLISTDVLMGKFADAAKRKIANSLLNFLFFLFFKNY